MSDQHVLAEQLQQLHDQWTQFARAPEARLLVWQATADETRMVEAFVTRECDVESAATADLFLQLTAPFAARSLHGLALASELLRSYEEATSANEATEQTPSWRPPQREERESETRFFVRLLCSLRAHLGQASEDKLVVWLRPSLCDDQNAYLKWLQALVHEAPSELRFVALDGPGSTAVAPLLAAEPVQVVAQCCALEIPRAVSDLRPIGEDSDPAALFGALQTRLAALIDAGDLAGAVAAASTACTLSAERGFPHFGALIQMMMAAAYAGQDDTLSALRAYAEADQLASEVELRQRESAPDQVPPQLGQRLRLQARLGQGAVLLAARAFKQAADIYLGLVALAQALGDERSELDCYRLASVCHAEAGQLPQAWELGMRGFAFGAALDEETQRTSSLAYLADHMLRMTDAHRDYRAHQVPLAQQAARVLGAQWREALLVGR